HFTGTKLSTSVTPPGTGAGSGRIALDSGGAPVDGCVAAGTVVGLLGIPNMTFPVGTTAANRVSTYHYTSSIGLLTGTPVDTKTGAITCPAGTAIGYTSVSPLGTFNLQPVLCFVPPVNTALPTISGPALVDSTLTANDGTWTPSAPNAPTLTRQWFRCDGTGNGCAAIPGATGTTYTLQFGSYPSEPTDFGHTFKVAVTGANLDGTATATSALTAKVQLPPPPAISTAPVLSANRKVGVAITATDGTYNPGATMFAYQWQRCDAAGTPASCADIPGATGSSYTVQSADKGRTLRIGVLASNHGGSAPINYSTTALIPPDPSNVTPPGIKSGATSVVGASVATGDNLAASAGTWSANAGPYTPATYRWQRCDASGTPASCTDIPGATGATYVVQHPDDDGGTLRVVETAHGLNGATPQASGATGVVLFNDLSAKPVTQIPDGTVNATVAGAGTTAYIGGAFDTVGAPTGGSGLVSDSGTGSAVALASQTAGAANGGVNATVPDGAGGYFLGGSFTQVKGIQCPGIAHLASDGSVDQAYCYSGLTGSVKALGRVTGGVSKVLVVGGDFTFGGHQNLMFIDPATPASPVFDSLGDPNGPVKTVAVNGSNNNVVYFGGQFSKLAGKQAALLAAETLTWTGGQLSSAARNSWSAGVCIGTPGGGSSACTDPAASVNTVAWLSTNFVAVGGRFNSNFRVVDNANPTSQATRNNALLVGDSGTSPTLLGW
ncbi:MAG TPA: hypothetical protein VHA75_09365, partial [Rugosimonospora sp.]|nr:hypothetical protein [Rugosimonospora sp.]